MRLEVAVVAHKSRRTMTEGLVAVLEPQAFGPTLQDTSIYVYEDSGIYGEWRNHARAMEAAALRGTASHVLVIQEDAIPIPSLLKETVKAIAERPAEVLGLYVGTGRPYPTLVDEAVHEAEIGRTAWLVARALFWGVATVYPVELLPSILKKAGRMTGVPYDERVGTALDRMGKKVYYTWPSLVDHQDTKTVIKGRVREEADPRRAHKIGQPDWSRGLSATPISILPMDAL